MKIVHLSDLHFGTQDAKVVAALAEAIRTVAPDLVVVSGDFTQAARMNEFLDAKNFIDSLNTPLLCVPGNHDVPGFDLMERLTHPYDRYQSAISEDMSPIYETDKVIVIGLNSARRIVPHWNWANGALSAAQREHVKKMVEGKGDKWLICTFHHPVHQADLMPIDVVVFGGHKMMKTLHDLGVDLVMTGHVHHASITMHGDAHHQTVYLSASTALSSRIRGQENGFNLVTLREHDMQIDMFKYLNGIFASSDTYTQRRF